MNIDKRNGDIAFNDDAHVYWNLKDDVKYTSVTTLIHGYTQPFDKEFWSSYKALERLMPKEHWAIEKKSLLQYKRFNSSLLDVYDIDAETFGKEKQAILEEWDLANKESCERGTAIHAELENSMYDMGDNVVLSRFGVGGKFVCKKGRTELDLEKGVYPEYLISRTSPDGELRLAGQIDLLIKNGNEITIVDYKGLPLGTEILTTKGWSTIGEVSEGDTIFDGAGNPTRILHKSEIHNNPCYKIKFDNGDEIVSDEDHRWEINFKTSRKKKPYDRVVMTTKELYRYLQTCERSSSTIPKILNPAPINMPKTDLLIDPYLLGAWLGDGSKSCGIITQAKDSKLWDEIRNRGYEIGENAQHNPDRTNVEMRTVYGLRTLLGKLNLLNNKHIPEEYYLASFEQRLDLLRGFMDTDGHYHPKRKRFVMTTGQEWQRDCLVKLLGTLGIKSSVFHVLRECDGKKFDAWDICFSTNGLNPFLIRNQDIEFPTKDKNSFRNINSIELVETVPTQCLEVDSPLHTFLVTDKCIITHNTNKEIKKKGGYDTATRSTVKMKYPLNNLDDCNYNHYTLQLSTYAWMVQQLNPDYIIKDLILIHFDHEDNQTIYNLEYLKNDVEKMLRHFKREIRKQKELDKLKPIEY